jgi:hypothetical protein
VVKKRQLGKCGVRRGVRQSVSWRISGSVSGGDSAGGGVLQGLQGFTRIFFSGSETGLARAGGRVARTYSQKATKASKETSRCSWEGLGGSRLREDATARQVGRLCDGWGRFGKGPRRQCRFQSWQCRFPLWQGHRPRRTFPTTGRRSDLGPGLPWFPSVSANAAFQRCHPVLTAVKSMCPVGGFRIFRQYPAGDVFLCVVSKRMKFLARVGIQVSGVNIGWNGVFGGGKAGSRLNTIRTDIFSGSAHSHWSSGSHRNASSRFDSIEEQSSI